MIHKTSDEDEITVDNDEHTTLIVAMQKAVGMSFSVTNIV